MRVPPTAGPRVVSWTAMTARSPDAASRRTWISSCPSASAYSSAVTTPPLALRPAVEPAEHLVVPAHGVGRLQHPVVLVGKDDEARGDAAELQGGEHPEPLLDGHAVILLPVDDEGR